MSISHNRSEVAFLRQQIELECQALRRCLSDFAITANHTVIANRYQQLDHCRTKLSQMVGEQAAMEMIISIYERTVQ